MMDSRDLTPSGQATRHKAKGFNMQICLMKARMDQGNEWKMKYFVFWTRNIHCLSLI